MSGADPGDPSHAADFSGAASALSLPPGFRLLSYEQLDSSNEEAKRLGRAGEPGGTVVLARKQVAGYGRRGRVWSSAEGNLAVSFLLRPEGPAAQAAQIGFVAALAVQDAIRPLLPAGVASSCKWPNDVLLDGRKIAGILLESELSPSGGGLEWVVLGIGVNIRAHPEDTPYPATSLAAAGVSEFSALDLLERLAPSLSAWLEIWRREGFSPIRSEWLRRSTGLGEPIVVRLDDGELEGRFAGLDGEGALLLESTARKGPELRRILAGDVFPPRPVAG